MPVVGGGRSFQVEVDVVAEMSANAHAFNFVVGGDFCE